MDGFKKNNPKSKEYYKNNKKFDENLIHEISNYLNKLT